MATSDYRNPAINSGFSDASDLIPSGKVSGLTAGSSMAGGNFVSPVADGTAPGSPSEQTSNITSHTGVVGPVDSGMQDFRETED